MDENGNLQEYHEVLEFKVISDDLDTVLNYQQTLHDVLEGKAIHAENGFWRIAPLEGEEGLRAVESQFSHPFGLNEFSFGHVGEVAGSGLPIVTMHAKETLDFHRPKHGKSKEKHVKGGEVTGLQREYWLDEDGKLNYKTWVGIDGKPLRHQLTGSLTRNTAIEPYKHFPNQPSQEAIEKAEKNSELLTEKEAEILHHQIIE